MQLGINITSQPIDPRSGLPAEMTGQAGAVVEFQGFVRGEEEGRAITALEYEAYSPMAEQVMRQIFQDIACRHPCLFAHVTHRIGVVPVGEAAIHVAVGSRHRAEAFAMLIEFMDRLKQDVPIWKRRALACQAMPAPKRP
jgi:molybdopterin synthase catalytic subunit